MRPRPACTLAAVVRSVLNQYSFVVIAIVVLSIAMAATWRVRRRWVRVAIPGTLAVGLVIAFLVLRTGGGNVRSVADLDRALAAGKPVMLEMYSDY